MNSFSTWGPGPTNTGNPPAWASEYDPTHGGTTLAKSTPPPPPPPAQGTRTVNPLDPSTWANVLPDVGGIVVGEMEKLVIGAAFYGLLFLGVLGLILPSAEKDVAGAVTGNAPSDDATKSASQGAKKTGVASEAEEAAIL